MSNEVTAPPAPFYQTPSMAADKSAGCISCHTPGDAPTMHVNQSVTLGCTDCHGGDAKPMRPASSPAYSRPPVVFAAKLTARPVRGAPIPPIARRWRRRT